MRDNVFLDSTILVYTVTKGDARSLRAKELLNDGGFISVQVLNEFVAVVRRKLKMPWPELYESLEAIRNLCEPPLVLTLDLHQAALKIAERYRYHIYDSLIIASALKAKCTILYSEDMHDGQKIDSLTIRNPFQPS